MREDAAAMIRTAFDTTLSFCTQHLDVIVLAVAAVIMFAALWRAAAATAPASHHGADNWVWRFPPFT
jgi:type II secretory pathway component PulF